MLLSAFSATAQVNKFVFASGMEFNAWNQCIFDKQTLIYFNRSDDNNYHIYQEAQRVLTEKGFDFFHPTSRIDQNDDFVTLTNIVYENAAYGSNAKSEFRYEREDVKIWVVLSEKGSRIVIYNQ
jgi:hypothetical protein